MSTCDGAVNSDLARQALFDALEVSGSIETIIDLFLYHSPQICDCTKDQRASLLRNVKTMKKAPARRFFDGIRKNLEVIEGDQLFLPQSCSPEDLSDEELDPQVLDEQARQALDFLKVASMCMETYLEGVLERNGKKSTQSIHVIDEVFQVMQILHNCLIALQASNEKGIAVQQKISSLCELWWKHHFQDRECMVTQLLPLLLAKSLDERSTRADINRLYAVRHALDAIDFEDNNSADIKRLMTRTVSSPLYIKTAEGNKLISYLFEHVALELHEAIRVQIPDAKKATLEAYGEIYYRAWKESSDPSIIEENILQDLAYAIIHVGNASMAKALKTILGPFHQGQSTPTVKEVLHRIYGPILWRSLRAANPRVRVNAASVLGVVFPLADGINIDKSVHKAIAALQHSMQDTDPRVRVAGSEATATVLVTLWDALPPTEIRSLLNQIVVEHASDVSSSAVRIGALNAISMLLEAEQSRAVLRSILPSLGNLIHDRVERVRLATVRLLQKIKTIPGIKYYHVVPVPHLLARMVEEGKPPKSHCNAVASEITNLIMNSYFPQNVATSDQIHRTVQFLSTEPRAAAIFYANLSNHLAINSVAKLVAMLLKCLIEASKSHAEHRKKRHFGMQQQNPLPVGNEHYTEKKDSISSKDTSLMASISETICCLWDSIENDLEKPENKVSREFLLDSFSGAVLANIHSHFQEIALRCNNSTQKDRITLENCNRVCASILRCAGWLPPENVQGLAQQITLRIQTIEGKQDSITPHIALLCLWGMTEEVATSLAGSILNAFDEDDLTFEPISSGRKRRSRRQSRQSASLTDSALMVPSLPSLVAMEVIECILRGADPSSVAARNAILSSASACSAIEKALEMATVFAERVLLCNSAQTIQLSSTDVELVLRACEAYGRLALHKEASTNNSDELSAQAKILLNWTTERVIPAINGQFESGVTTPFRSLDLSRISLVSDTPGSPGNIPPQSKRTDRKSTPQKLDSSFALERSIVDTSFTQAPGLFSRSAAMSLLHSSCVIFSEWLVVGGAGAKEIANAAQIWTNALSRNDIKVHDSIFPTLLRLAVHLCANGCEFSLIESLFIYCGESDIEVDTLLFQQAIKALILGRDSDGISTLGGLLSSLINSAKYIINQGENLIVSSETDPPSDWNEVLGFKGGNLILAFDIINSNKNASVTLAEMIVAALETQSDKEDSNAILLFYIRCIWFMSERAIDPIKFQAISRKIHAIVSICSNDKVQASMNAFIITCQPHSCH